jgi:hypothetical protein
MAADLLVRNVRPLWGDLAEIVILEGRIAGGPAPNGVPGGGPHPSRQVRTDPLDRRSVLVQRTVAGNGFMRDLKTILTNAGNEVGKVPTRGRRAGETV